ncbi:MAG: hypothetical protein ACI9LY_003463 [Arenicella sp.]
MPSSGLHQLADWASSKIMPCFLALDLSFAGIRLKFEHIDIVGYAKQLPKLVHALCLHSPTSQPDGSCCSAAPYVRVTHSSVHIKAL